MRDGSAIELEDASVQLGGRTVWMDPNGDPKGHTPPLSWEEALKYGHYMLDERGKLKPFYADVVRMVADADVALFFGHATHREIDALAEMIDRVGYLVRGKYELAIAQLKLALQDVLYATPSHAEGNLGYAYYRKGERALGIKHIKNATLVNPKRPAPGTSPSRSITVVAAKARRF